MSILVRNINNFALILFVFGVNFEYWDPFGLKGVFSIAKITAIIYIASWLPFLKEIRLKPLAPFLVPLVIYLLVEFFSSAVNNIHVTKLIGTFNFTMIKLLVILVLIVNHIIKKPYILKWILITFVGNVFLLSVLSIFGVGFEANNFEEGEDRLLMFGENPNMVGMKASFAIIMLFYFIVDSKKIPHKIILCAFFIPIISLLVSTASRGALLTVFLGIAVMVMFQKTSIVKKVVISLIGIIFSVGLFKYIMSNNENFATRMTLFIEEGETGRNEIWNSTYNIILDNLIIGVGRPGALPVMQQYLGAAKDTHNVFLYVLMTTGIIGFIFFMTFIIRLAIRLYIHFKLTNNVIYIVLFMILLFNMLKAGGFINKTFLWFFFAMLIGSTIYVSHKRIQN